MANRLEEDGLIVSVEPWFDFQSMETGFGLDFPKGGYSRSAVGIRIHDLFSEKRKAKGQYL